MFENLTDVANDYPAINPERKTVQDYEYDLGEFDVVLLHNSINHLDEEACMHLHDSSRARTRYNEIFEQISELTSVNGSLLIADVTRTGLWRDIGLPNPFPATLSAINISRHTFGASCYRIISSEKNG